MRKALVVGATCAFFSTSGLLSVSSAGANEPAPTVVQATGETTTVLDQQAVEEIVRNYLLKNPEIILEVQQALEDKQREEQRVANLEIIKAEADTIFRSPSDGVFGNPNGKTTVVEFFDYNCGYCKRAMADMQEMTAADPDLRFVLKELPILGPDSAKSHQVAQAFMKLMPAKYGEFHTRLLGSEGRATEETAMLVATSLGADEAAMRKAMEDPAIEASFQSALQLANKLQITGTPSYVIGDEVVFGALGKETLSEKVKAARAACETAAC